jgi:hypothetical protein
MTEPSTSTGGGEAGCLRNVMQRLHRGSTPPASTQPYSYLQIKKPNA